jgi:hypothetical protein
MQVAIDKAGAHVRSNGLPRVRADPPAGQLSRTSSRTRSSSAARTARIGSNRGKRTTVASQSATTDRHKHTSRTHLSSSSASTPRPLPRHRHRPRDLQEDRRATRQIGSGWSRNGRGRRSTSRCQRSPNGIWPGRLFKATVLPGLFRNSPKLSAIGAVLGPESSRSSRRRFRCVSCPFVALILPHPSRTRAITAGAEDATRSSLSQSNGSRLNCRRTFSTNLSTRLPTREA